MNPPSFIESSSTVGLALVASSTIPVLTPKEMVEAEFTDAPVMVRVARAESGFNPLAKNPHSSATGLFQILKSTWTATGCTGTSTIASDNIACARKLYDDAGTAPWTASEAGWK